VGCDNDRQPITHYRTKDVNRSIASTFFFFFSFYRFDV
jgi:hypothetical protein